jgi:hypothetical protein
MAVIIDTFEVISETENSTSSPGTNNTQGAANTVLKPADIEAVLEHQYVRNNRLRAH